MINVGPCAPRVALPFMGSKSSSGTGSVAMKSSDAVGSSSHRMACLERPCKQPGRPHAEVFASERAVLGCCEGSQDRSPEFQQL